MDHKVSKDMISSGMIPSGEKTQSDLGRTQYGSAPSPNKLMDAYKSMYDKKEEVINEMAGVSKIVKGGRSVRSLGAKKPEGTFLSRQKEKLAAETGKKPTPKVYGQTPTEVRTRADKDSSTYAYRPSDAENPRDFAIAKKPETTYTPTPESEIKARRARVKEMESQGKVRKTSYEKVDLLAAYHSIYEHHQKDKDGNTIPHEDEEVNEGKIPAGLQAYLDKKKGKKEDKKDDKEMKESVEEKVIKIKKDLGESADLFDIISTYFIEEGYDKKDIYAAMSSIDLSEEVQDLHEIVPAVMAGIKAVGGQILKRGLGRAVTRAGIKLGGKMGGQIGKTITKNPMTSYMVARDLMPTGGGGGNQQPMMSKKTSSISASADLFDIVKGQLLDEGLSEEEIKDIMLTLTPDEILNEISAETALAASKARDVQAGKLKGPENTEKRAELRAKASQNYDRSVEKRKAGFVKNTATPQGPSRIPTGGM